MLLRLPTQIALAASLLAPALLAQDPLHSLRLDLALDSGPVSNEGTRPQVLVSLPVSVEGAAWLRLEFAAVELSGSAFEGTGSILRITSLLDGAVQELDAVELAQWRNTSAYFNGGDVLVEIVARPGTGTNRVVLAAVHTDLSGAPESICGPTDDRVLSSDNRAGRLVPVGCTGWIIDDCNSCMLTAGHCTGTSLQTLQFNVPLSTGSGALQHPPPEHQYAIDTANVQTNGGQGVGNDWGYFGVFPNSNTGLTPFQAYGARFTLVAPPTFNAAHDIRITGYGTRSSPAQWNQVQETHTGPWAQFSATTLRYTADTTGGNSGSPVIHEPTGNAIGIHTHGGCTSTGGSNAGTASIHAGLQAALAAPTGVCASGFTIVGTLPSSMAVGVPAPVQIQATGSIVAGSPTLHYRYGGGGFTAVAMTAGANSLYSGTLPAPQCGDLPQYYISAQSVSCGAVTNPPGAPANFHTATVSGGVEALVRSESFEVDTGWTTSFSGATAGLWERGVPVNDPSWAYDPATDGDGSGSCWLTQNALGNTDVDNGSVTLLSPALDLSGGNVAFRYAYYLNLTVADGTDRLLVEASTNGTSGPWTVVATHTTSSSAWVSHEITAASLAAAGVVPGAATRLRFTANDSGTQSIVEAGLDAFRVVRTGCDWVVRYCQSGALGSVLTATGSTSLAANNFALHASQIPPQKSGLFFYSRARASAPFGNGTRCVGTPAARLPLVQSGAGTTLDLALNFNALPSAGAIVAGDLWNFQCWFRDGALYDLSDALQVIFVP